MSSDGLAVKHPALDANDHMSKLFQRLTSRLTTSCSSVLRLCSWMSSFSIFEMPWLYRCCRRSHHQIGNPYLTWKGILCLWLHLLVLVSCLFSEFLLNQKFVDIFCSFRLFFMRFVHRAFFLRALTLVLLTMLLVMRLSNFGSKSRFRTFGSV